MEIRRGDNPPQHQPIEKTLKSGQNFFDQAPFNDVVSQAQAYGGGFSVSAVRLGISLVASEVQNPFWDSIEEMRSRSAMVNIRRRVIARNIRRNMINKLDLNVSLTQAVGLAGFIEESLDKVPETYPYLEQFLFNNKHEFSYTGDPRFEGQQQTFLEWQRFRNNVRKNQSLVGIREIFAVKGKLIK